MMAGHVFADSVKNEFRSTPQCGVDFSPPRGFSLASLALRLIVSDAVVNGGKCEVRYCDGTLIKQ